MAWQLPRGDEAPRRQPKSVESPKTKVSNAAPNHGIERQNLMKQEERRSRKSRKYIFSSKFHLRFSFRKKKVTKMHTEYAVHAVHGVLTARLCGAGLPHFTPINQLLFTSQSTLKSLSAAQRSNERKVII